MNKEQLSPKYNIKLRNIFKFIHKLFKKKYNIIEVVIPKGFYNCAISIHNNFIADTNDSKNWDTLRFPLPKPKYKWNIKCYKGDANNLSKKTIELIDCP